MERIEIMTNFDTRVLDAYNQMVKEDKAHDAYWSIAEILRNMPQIHKKLVFLALEMDLRREPWLDNIPYFSLDPDWEISIVPAYDCLFRGRIHSKTNPGRLACFYLDAYDSLGCWNLHKPREQWEPYWETYDGTNTQRFAMSDMDGFMGEIRRIMNGESEAKY